MGFMSSYKQLERLLNDMYADQHGVTAYIEEMKNTPNGDVFVQGFNDDLKQLKHYRWIRNQIVHDPDCTEESMCKKEDADWINGFYYRVINRTDPLALYRRARQPKPSTGTARSKQDQTLEQMLDDCFPQPHQTEKPSGNAVWWICMLIMAVFILFLVLKFLV